MSNQGQGRGKPGDEFIFVRMPSIGVRKTELVFLSPFNFVVRGENFWRDPSDLSFIGFEY